MKRNHLQQTRTISQWFLNIFIIISFLFCLALIPLLIYLQNTFTGLQLEKSKQQLNSGISQITSTVNGLLNISVILSSDSRFLTLHYKKADYTNISATTRNQLQDTFENLTFSFQPLSHAALLLAQNVVITDDTVFFEDHTCYYPDFFSVNGLSYTEWEQLLSDNGTGFLPVCRVKTHKTEYDALIFTTPWMNSTYIYACMNISDIKKILIESDRLDDCYFSITGTDGTLLYSDLPDTSIRCQTITESVPYGKCSITVHIPNSVFYRNMKPLYFFLGVYCFLCMIMLILVILLGTKVSAKPFMDIIHILERSRNIALTASSQAVTLSDSSQTVEQRHIAGNPKHSFEYISASILNADRHLEEYQNVLHTQQKILQARFLEKAIGGYVFSDKDVQQFQSYFPNFPENYRLLLFRLWAYAENTSLPYSEPLLLLQAFLESELPNVYQQQLSDTELLLLISEEDFESYRHTLDFMVNNINREEPSYFARCIASLTYHRLENLSIAYRQLQDMDELSVPDHQVHIYSAADHPDSPRVPVAMSELMTLYTAITSGNREMAISRLHSISKELSLAENISFRRPVYETLQAMLTYVIQEHSNLLAEQSVPVYQSNKAIYEQLEESVSTFSEMISNATKTQKDSFTEELFLYIDNHYTDCDLCISSLTTHFKCSESAIRKAFKSVTDVTISRYIEQKRMDLANELLAQNQKSIAEIALECGFALPHSFYKAYKRVYGHAPTMQ